LLTLQHKEFMNLGTVIWLILKVTFLILIFNGKDPCTETYVWCTCKVIPSGLGEPSGHDHCRAKHVKLYFIVFSFIVNWLNYNIGRENKSLLIH
jgi:hypothetical protein